MSMETMDKPTMLKMVRESWQALEETLARFDDAQMLRANPPDGWTVQDLMFHISHWEMYLWQRLQEVGQGQQPAIDRFFDQEWLAQVTDEVQEEGRARTLDEVKAEFQRTHQILYSELERLPDNQDQAWWSLWPSTEVGWQIIVYSSADHYAEHLRDLKTWLDNG